MTVIDLGEVRGDTAPEPSPRRPPPTGRPYRSLVVLPVALLTPAGGEVLVGRRSGGGFGSWGRR